MLRRKHDGETQVLTLGNWPDMTLAEARVEAAKVGGKRVSTITLSALLETWHAEIVSKTYRRPRAVAQYFDRLEPSLRATKLRDLDRLAIRTALRRYSDQRGPIAANRLLSILKTALQFAVNIGHLETSPIIGLSSAPHIVEKILGHRLQGLMAVYNHADYPAERFVAMQKWSDEVERIVGAK